MAVAHEIVQDGYGIIHHWSGDISGADLWPMNQQNWKNAKWDNLHFEIHVIDPDALVHFSKTDMMLQGYTNTASYARKDIHPVAVYCKNTEILAQLQPLCAEMLHRFDLNFAIFNDLVELKKFTGYSLKI